MLLEEISKKITIISSVSLKRIVVKESNIGGLPYDS